MQLHEGVQRPRMKSSQGQNKKNDKNDRNDRENDWQKQKNLQMNYQLDSVQLKPI